MVQTRYISGGQPIFCTRVLGPGFQVWSVTHVGGGEKREGQVIYFSDDQIASSNTSRARQAPAGPDTRATPGRQLQLLLDTNAITSSPCLFRPEGNHDCPFPVQGLTTSLPASMTLPTAPYVTPLTFTSGPFLVEFCFL